MAESEERKFKFPRKQIIEPVGEGLFPGDCEETPASIFNHKAVSSKKVWYLCYYLNQFLSITQQLTQKNALTLAWTSELCFFLSQLRFLTVFASAHLGFSVASPSRPGSRHNVHWEQRGDVPCSTCTAWAPAQVWELDPCGSQEETSRVGFIPPLSLPAEKRHQQLRVPHVPQHPGWEDLQ